MNKKHNILHYLFTVIFLTIKSLASLLVWFFFGLAGFVIFSSKKTPFDIILGLPMLLVGVGFMVHSLETALLSIFSPRYNKEVCRLCRNNI